MKTTIAAVIALMLLPAAHAAAPAADIVRHPSPGNPPFPIARAVEVPANYRIIYHSGLTASPADPKAKEGTPQYWGDTKAQSLSVLNRMKESLQSMGLGFGDVVKMTAFLVGDPEKGGRMDFAGFMEAYSQFFGTKEQPNLPARSTVQVASLVAPGLLVEIEVTLAKKAP